MSQPRIFPFKRVSVDHMIRGVTRVWWQLDSAFNDTGPYSFQLQVGRTGLKDATDWKNVGEPVVDGYVALDPAWRESGYDNTVHYRVVLTTARTKYVSQAASCFGQLNERDWLIAGEIVRKEQVRNKLVASPGYLLKRMRYGKQCTRCLDPLTKEITDNDCPECGGTGFAVGWHPPLAMQCWDLSPQVIDEDVDNNAKGNTRNQPYVTARVIGFPAVNKWDVWVNANSDERWSVESIQIVAAIRNIPLVYQLKLGLLPFSNSAYAIEVGGEVVERTGPSLPVSGCGAITVDQDYLGPDSLIYQPEEGCPVVGATVLVFNKADFDAHGVTIDPALAVGSTTTRVNGRWSSSIRLDPADYVLLFEKLGEYGPDTFNLTVVDPSAGLSVQTDVPPETESPTWEEPENTNPASPSTDSSTSAEFPTLNKQTRITGTNNFWDI